MVGHIGYGHSYLKFLFCHLNVIRLQAILDDAAGTVQSHCGKSPGYCYMIRRGRKSCMLGHVTGLLICLHVKLFPSSILIFVNFWKIMPWYVFICILRKQAKLFYRFRKLVLMDMFTNTILVLHEKFKPKKPALWVEKNCTELCRTVVVWNTVTFETIFVKT